MNWTREQTIVALYAYCIVPFNKATNNNPTIIELAPKIGRSVTALKMKIGNFGSLDPKLAQRGIVGLGNYSHMDKKIWKEFNNHWDKLFAEASKIISQSDNTNTASELPQGTETLVQVKQRVNQSFFRSMVLSAYEGECCISGVKSTELLEAAHIIPWCEDESLRTDPTNGLCLNSFFHMAYDNNLISITPDYEVAVSDRLVEETSDGSFKNYLHEIQGNTISLPTKFYPNPDYLAIRYERYKTTL